MNVKGKRIETLIVASLLLLSFSMICNVRATYPLLPQLEVKAASATVYEVWLTGEGGASLDAYWDIIGFDMYLRFDRNAMTTTASKVVIDPDLWWAGFYPQGVPVTIKTVDNTRGIVRASFVGKPLDGGGHTAPSGTGRLLTVTFTTPAYPTKPYLRNPEPRIEMPEWDRLKFIVDVSGFPHPERTEAPWMGAPGSPKIPHVVLPALPIASFTESASTVYKGTAINFDASGSSDPDGFIVGYQWDFQNDGIIDDTTVNPSYTYTKVGTYLVTLLVTDNEGLAGSASATKKVLSQAPVAVITRNVTTPVYTGIPINFDASASYDPDGTVKTYYWDWVDGTAGSTAKIVAKKFMFPGIFNVKLTATDNDATPGYATVAVTILDGLPRALFTANATTVYTFEPVLFDASASYDPEGTITKYNWEFTQIPPQGSAIKTGKIATMAWTKAYNYKALLEVIDNLGVSSAPEIFGHRTRTNMTITVLNRAPIAMFTESVSSAYRDEVIFFDASGSYDLDGTIAFYYWDFGDGTTATGKTTSHAYSTAGDFKVTLTVTDDELAASTAIAYKSVANARMPPDALVATHGWAEHPVYRVSGDEDQYNTLYAEVQNLWRASVNVKVVFTVLDVRTGGTAGTLQATGTAPAGQTIVLEADFDPAAFDYIPGTRTKYIAYGQLYYFDGRGWIPIEAPYGTFKIEFKVVP